MKQSEKTKQRLLASFMALVMCISMFSGTTMAWFTDTSTSGVDIIKSGKLDVGMLWTDDLERGEWKDAEDTENPENRVIFSTEKWEPGYTEVRYIKVKNNGNLAFKYKLAVVPVGQVDKLAEVIDVYFVDDADTAITTRQQLQQMIDDEEITAAGTLKDVMNGQQSNEGYLLPQGKISTLPEHHTGEHVMAVVLRMQEEAGNAYQNASIGDGFTVNIIASQMRYEYDSNGNDYDTNAEYDVIDHPVDITVDIPADKVNDDNRLTDGLMITGPYNVFASIPVGTKLDEGAAQLRFTVKYLENDSSNFTVLEGEQKTAVDVHIEGVAEDNDMPITIGLGNMMSTGLNSGNYTVSHIEDGNANTMSEINGTLSAHNQYDYDPATGNVVISIATFSEIVAQSVASEGNPWNGVIDTKWYSDALTINPDTKEFTIANADQLAGFGAIVGGMGSFKDKRDSFAGKTVKLISDINLGDGEDGNNPNIIFYPIGYYNDEGTYERTGTKITSDVNSFEGTFDGNGHTISNFYQNTWEMKGDDSYYSATEQYYNDAMGLFGYVLNGTVKNLTVNNFKSDGEFTPTGVIAAYAVNSTFENIAITNCNPRVYNTGNGGVIGIAGNTGDQGTQITLKNITVDKTNKISALWGSWDVACGGLVGMFRGNADGGTGKIHFEDCHVAAQIDVYNDVCANYQYYAYRYAGMIIGSVRHNTKTEDGKYTIPNMTGITADRCTVNYGDWNDYWYCEFVDNSLASYTHDHQFSRVPRTEIDISNGKENATCIGHNHGRRGYETTDIDGDGVIDSHVLKEDKQAVYLPFHQLFTGYSWGVTSVGLEKFGGIYIEGVTESDQNEPEVKFEIAESVNGKKLRVGNGNAFPVGKLFRAIDGKNIDADGVFVTATSMVDGVEITSTFTLDKADWKNSTLKINGTGPAKITIQDYQYCIPTEIEVEVINADNAATGALSATRKDVVLLDDLNFSTLTVSGGHTLHGNGFTLSSLSDITGDGLNTAYVELNNGNLDNVQIVCPNFSHQIMYMSQAKVNGNVDAAAEWRYHNIRSAVTMKGISKISNSYISGGRAAVYILNGNAVVDNTTLNVGALANIHIGTAQSVTLRDTTLIQQPTKATVNDTTVTKMGFSVVVTCDGDGSSTPITLEGTLNQYAWANTSYSAYFPDNADTIVESVMQQNNFKHNFILHEGETAQDWLNLGIAYMPADLGYSVKQPTVIDNRADKDAKPYDYAKISAIATEAYVYSYKNTNVTDENLKQEPGYTSPESGAVLLPTLSYKDIKEGVTFSTAFDSQKGWTSTLEVDLDTVGSYSFSFDNLIAGKNGQSLAYSVKAADGNTVNENIINLTGSGVTDYILYVTDNDGETIHEMPFTIVAKMAKINPPEKVAEPSGTPLLVVKSKNSDWSCALPALEGTQIKYWSVADSEYKTLTLSDLTPTSTGKQNGTNNFWTYTGPNNDYTLKITCGYIHKDKQIYGMPVVVNNGGNKMYFTISSTNGYVSTGTTARTVTLTYDFMDNNGGELTFTKSWNCVRQDMIDDGAKQYSYSDFVNGTLKEATTTCVTPDTLITLANGSQKEIQYVTYDDELLVWDFYKGEYATVPAAVLINHGEGLYDKITLKFADGTKIDILDSHGFFNKDLNNWVYINKDNVESYVGDTFIKNYGSRYKGIELVDYTVITEYTTAYSAFSALYYNCFFEDMLTLTPSMFGGENYYVPFEIGENLKYDEIKMQADIEKYGLYTYEDFKDHVTYEQFIGFGAPYFKVSVGKGLVTYDQLIESIYSYVN